MLSGTQVIMFHVETSGDDMEHNDNTSWDTSAGVSG